MHGKVTFGYSRDSELCGIIPAEAVGDFPAKTAAESGQKLVHHRWLEHVVVAKAYISSVLRHGLAEDRSQIRITASVRIVVVEAAGNPLLVRNIVIDLDVKNIRSRAVDCGVNHVVGEGGGGLWQQRKNLGHHRARCEVRIIRQNVSGNRSVPVVGS